MKNNKKIIGVGLFTSLASSLCCIAPLLAIISGTTGLATSFSWLESYRIPLLILTVLSLSFAWYQQLKPVKKMDCNCDTDQKKSFLHSKKFLSLVTVFAILMTLFPHYSSTFYPKKNSSNLIIDSNRLKTINLKINGMTCVACENQINFKVQQQSGIIDINTSFKNKNTQVKFDTTQTNQEKIIATINKTGYTVQK